MRARDRPGQIWVDFCGAEPRNRGVRRRKGPLLLTALTGLSLVLAFGTVALRVRSFGWRDEITYVTASGDGYLVGTAPRALVLTYAEDLRAQRAAFVPVADGWSTVHELYVPDSGVTTVVANATVTAGPPTTAPSAIGTPVTSGAQESITEYEAVTRETLAGGRTATTTTYTYTATSGVTLGVGRSATCGPTAWHGVSTQTYSGIPLGAPPTARTLRTSHLIVPLGWPIVLFLMLPAARFGLYLVRLSRRPQPTAKCAACGYDLRASTGNCPECGATPSRHALRVPRDC
jgi:hypothetical protein